MNFNRQVSAPSRPAPSPPRRPLGERMTSLESIQRTNSPSPTNPGASPRLERSYLAPIQSGVQMSSHQFHQQHLTPGNIVIRFTGGSPQQQPQTIYAQNTVVSRPNIFETNSELREGYIKSMLAHQNKCLTIIRSRTDDLEYRVNYKRNNVDFETRKTLEALVRDDDLDSICKIDQVLEAREMIRKLKVDISGLVAEIDSFGDLYLGHDDCKPVQNRRTSSSAESPPIPPRPSYDKLHSQTSQPFNALTIRVPPSRI